MITLKHVAAKANVSRGTVDRVLNNRGNVKCETELRVRQALEDLGYQPNRAGKGLAAVRKSVRLGIILASEGNRFFDDVLDGIADAADMLRDYNVQTVIRTARGYDVDQQLRLIKDLRDNQVNGIAIAPINDSRVCAAIDDTVRAGIRVITLNQDIWGSMRSCYIGSDYIKSGEIAAGILHLICGDKPAKVGIITGSSQMMGHNQRIFGFEKILRSRYENFEICQIIENNDDDEISYDVTTQMLQHSPGINCFYFAAAGVTGGVRAILETCKSKPTVVACDTTKEITELVKKGSIQASVGQQPYEQGYRAINTLFDMIANETMPKSEFMYVKNEIYIAESN